MAVAIVNLQFVPDIGVTIVGQNVLCYYLIRSKPYDQLTLLLLF
jgi:hypothetical protein